MFIYNKETPLQLHSGETSPFKIDCDSLTDKDYTSLADFIRNYWVFRSVEGIPSGGTRLSKCLQKYCNPSISTWHMIVDDVYTTGQSMELARAHAVSTGQNFTKIAGIVIFARRPTPEWICPLFTLNQRMPQT